ncbi:peptidase M23, partial [Streptomyces sp. SID13588]|uniref:CIS tube protein n=1 Tax=Streptomyces sp. SID13588 TaxID=2706051 RepID=UPI0013C6B694
MASSSGAGKSLVRASLAIHEPPVGDGTSPGALMKTFDFDFNPPGLQLQRRTLWKAPATAAVRDGATPEFMGPEPREMTVEIFLDTSDEPSSNTVLRKVESLLDCCQVTSRSIAAKRPSPPWVVFQWGSFSTARFIAYVAAVDVSYSLFGTTGVPIRATCRVSLHEI